MDLQNDPLLRNVPGIKGYKVLRPAVLYAKIGQGGMGAVYRGRHLNLDVDVAVKCLKPSLADEGAQFIARFQREAKLAAGIHHENLIHVYDVASEAGVHYLVMEYISGETVRERVKRKGPLKDHEAATILLGAARGLAVAHKKRIVHRDIKPDNILISRDGVVKVADLGIARSAAGEDVALTYGSLGTPQYMPPEQWMDASKVAPAADVWSLGATLYFMLVGENAIQASTQGECALQICNQGFPDIGARRPEVDVRLRDLLRRMTERDPARRPANGAEVARELEHWLGEAVAELADESASGSKVQTLVSPPPALTLAQIRVEVGTHGRADVSVTEEYVRSQPPGPVPPSSAVLSRAAVPKAAQRKRIGYAAACIAGGLLLAAGISRFFGEGNGGESASGDSRQAEEITPAPHVPAIIRIIKPEQDSTMTVASIDVVVEIKGPDLESVQIGSVKAKRETGSQWKASGVSLSDEGKNTIPIVARDTNGIKSSTELMLVRDSTPPEFIRILDPRLGTTTQESSIDVVAEVMDAQGVRIGTVEAKRETGNRWKASDVPLPKEGKNVVTVEARDAVGNRAKPHAFEIIRSEPPPVSSATTEHAPSAKTPDTPKPRSASKRSLPENLTVFDRSSGEGGWPKKVRESKTGIVLLLVESGTFEQGFDPLREGKGMKPEELAETEDERPKHAVSIVSPFYLGETEVTIGQWRIFAEETGYKTEAEESGCGRVLEFEVDEAGRTSERWKTSRGAVWSSPRAGLKKDDERAVTQVSWVDAERFCSHYELALPTESQWEYACRAGSETRFWWGDREEDAHGKANLMDVSLRTLMKEATLKFDDENPFAANSAGFMPNDWGFKHMHGNVWEWCSDSYDKTLYGRRESSASALPKTSEERVLRGGSWWSKGIEARSSERRGVTKSGKVAENYGFRVSWTPPP